MHQAVREHDMHNKFKAIRYRGLYQITCMYMSAWLLIFVCFLTIQVGASTCHVVHSHYYRDALHNAIQPLTQGDDGNVSGML